MKTNRSIIASITTAAFALIASAATSNAANRALVLLQENSNGSSYLDGILTGAAKFAADSLVDSCDALKFESLAAGRYQKFINLSDANCTRAKLLDTLITQSKAGRTIDLVVLGHGSDNSLLLHNSERLTGDTTRTRISPTGQLSTVPVPGTLRTLLANAKTREGSGFTFKLRTVYMCNCFGSTLNDDWRAIGARVSVGSLRNNYMPEPMITSFWDGFVKNDSRVTQAASDAFAAASLVWQLVPGYNTPDPVTGLTRIQESRPVVSGDGNIIFKDECQLALNEQRTVTVSAKNAYNFPGIYLVAGQRYTYAASGRWNSGALFSSNVNANGYTPGGLDAPRNSANMMCLVGERFAHNNDILSFIRGSGFNIGTSATSTAGGHGFLNLFANDNLLGYGDNTGSVSVTIKRIQ
jgi:hypothetical protein